MLATLVTKRRHLSAKRRQLILAEGLLPSLPLAASDAPGRPACPPTTERIADAEQPTIDIADPASTAASHRPPDNDAIACSPSSCRLFYVDPVTLEPKGVIPWTAGLHAELLPKGQFRIHTPGRTYYLEDATGDSSVAELWVQTICHLQARATPPAAAMHGSQDLFSERSMRVADD